MNNTKQQEEALFEAARKLADPGKRQAFLDLACEGDAELRGRLEELLTAQSKADQFNSEGREALAGIEPTTLGKGVHPVAAGATIRVTMPPDEMPGERIGPYKLLQKVGEGGCGAVYMAEQEQPIRRRVALKVIKLGMDTKQVIARFEAERQALALMDHPNIAKVLDAGATDKGRPFFVMELVRGVPITQYCDENKLPMTERLRLFIAICHAVQHAHQKGIIHRDIKPSNILVTLHDGVPVPKVIDFGIAKATDQRLTDKTLFTQLQAFVGTPAYCSPEQAEMTGLDIDTRSDIYSLGVLLYELLTGTVPFDAQRLLHSGLDEMRRIIREEDPARPSTRMNTLAAKEQSTVALRRGTDARHLVGDLSGDLDWIVMKTLEKDRTRRYETATSLAQDLERFLNQEPVSARAPSTAYLLSKLVRRHRAAFAAAAAVAVALVGGIAVSGWQAVRATRAEHEQASLRKKADDSAGRAAAEARRSREAASALKLALATSEFLQAQSLIREGHKSQALVYLSKSLSDNPTNQGVLVRLATLLANHNWPMPGPTLKHNDSVLSAIFSPNGQSILTACDDGTAQLRDAHTGQSLVTPMKHGEAVKTAQFSPDGTRIVTASADHTARVWDTRTGQSVGQPLKHGAAVESAEFSPDGQRIVTASSDGTARVWDARTGLALAEPIKHNAWVSSAQFSPDGTRVLTGCYSDQTARVWDARTGQPLTEPMKQNAGISSATFSHDGTRIVTTSFGGPAYVWDGQTGQRIITLKNNGKWIYSAQFSPDDQRIVTASEDSTARVWDAKTGEPLISFLHESSVISARFSLDGKWIATASRDNTARVWNSQTGQPLTESLNHESQVVSARFSPDGTRIVTASRDNTAQVWEIGESRMLAESLTDPSAPMFPPNDLRSRQQARHSPNWAVGMGRSQFSPDGTRIVSASGDNKARVWDTQTGQLLTAPMNHNGRIWSSQFSPDGTRVVTASDDSTARVWDALSGQPLTPPIRHSGEVWSAQFSPDGRKIVTASWEGTARVWDASTGNPLTPPLKHEGPVRSARFSPDGIKIVTAAEDGTARIWDASNGKPVTEPLKHREFLVFSAQFSPDSQRIVTGCWDYTARIWDARTGQPLGQPLKHNNWVGSAQFSPDGRRIVTASFDNTARIWDAQTGQPLTEPMKHNNWVYSADFSSNGLCVVTLSSDGDERIWDAHTGQPLTEPMISSWGFLTVQFSPDGRRIATTSPDQVTQVREVMPDYGHSPEWLLSLAEIISGHIVNQDGVFKPTPLNRAQALDDLRQKLSREPESDPWSRWGRWFLADCRTRTISPNSKITISQQIEQRIKSPTADGLKEAEELAAGNGELLRRIEDTRVLLDQHTQSLQLQSQEIARSTQLRSQAIALAQQGKLDEAEALCREALTTQRKLLGDNHPDVALSLTYLVEILMLERKFAEAEQIFDEVLTPALENQPKSAELLGARGSFRARLSHWKEAEADFSKTIEFEPENHWNYHLLAPLLVQSGDLEGYRRHRARIVARFGGTKDPVVAERMAKACLILPSPGVDLMTESNWADTAVAASKDHPLLAYFQFAKGLAEYRQDHFASAVEWTQKVLAKTGEAPSRDVFAFTVLAMAQYRSKQTDSARSTLAKADEIMAAKQPKLESGDLGGGWADWIIAQTLLREAKALIEGQGAKQ